MEESGSPGGKGCPGTSMMNEKKSQTIKLNYKSKEKNDLKSLQTKAENKTEKTSTQSQESEQHGCQLDDKAPL